ncbi:uncharacterized protein METZ01_LOCUS104920 [marine metagenome]|uniref:Uncharacterized protein n=1 Tax=marine metagenome TaxID=408172 RepID=A0A381WHS4_9ZZZZ
MGDPLGDLDRAIEIRAQVVTHV